MYVQLYVFICLFADSAHKADIYNYIKVRLNYPKPTLQEHDKAKNYVAKPPSWIKKIKVK